jgi:glycine/D-amino acid oxidase-like deaminating enzyme
MSAPRLPASLWAATAPPAPELTPLAGETQARVAVVGGGFTGLSVALHLAERGIDTVLLEAGEIGHGASGRNNGQVIPHYTTHAPADVERLLGAEAGARMNALVGGSADCVFELVRRYGIDCEAVQAGWMQPAHAPGLAARGVALARAWAERGFDTRPLDAGEVVERLGAGGYHGGWMAASGGHVNPLALARGLARVAATAGARLHPGSAAQGIAATADGWRLETSGGAVTAAQVVIATNAYTDGLWPDLARSVIPVRTYQIATTPLGDNLRRSVLPSDMAVSDTRQNLRFFRYDRAGRLVTGATLSLWTGAERRARRERARFLRMVFPQLGEVAFEHYWEGWLAVTPSRLPKLQRLAPGVLAVLGYSGRGVALATALGQVVAEHLDGRPEAELPLPVTPPAPVPGHVFARVATRALRPWLRWQDVRAR